MNAVIKEETKMERPAMTYLQMYKEFINGYKHYKMEKGILNVKVDKVERNEE